MKKSVEIMGMGHHEKSAFLTAQIIQPTKHSNCNLEVEFSNCYINSVQNDWRPWIHSRTRAAVEEWSRPPGERRQKLVVGKHPLATFLCIAMQMSLLIEFEYL